MLHFPARLAATYAIKSPISLSLQRRFYSSKPLPTFSYLVSAAFSAKSARTFTFAEHTYHHLTKTSALPHPPNAIYKPRHQSGEDAFFISDFGGGSKQIAFGVTDGVGGWNDSGISPAHFSHGMCSHAIDIVSTPDPTAAAATAALSPQAIMQGAYDRILLDPQVIAGSSTACIGTASPQGTLRIANLGDSGFVHFAPWRIAHVSVPQQDGFNCPYQLTKLTPDMEHQEREQRRREELQRRLYDLLQLQQRWRRQQQRRGGENNNMWPEKKRETPGMADSCGGARQLAHGDVFVLATDGVWDNLFHENLLDIVAAEMHQQGAWVARQREDQLGNTTWSTSIGDLRRMVEHQLEDRRVVQVPLSQKLAWALALSAKHLSYDYRRESPFSRAATLAYPMERTTGGKIDDVCVVVGIAVQDEDP